MEKCLKMGKITLDFCALYAKSTLNILPIWNHTKASAPLSTYLEIITQMEDNNSSTIYCINRYTAHMDG